jgi:hypothetical protein
VNGLPDGDWQTGVRDHEAKEVALFAWNDGNAEIEALKLWRKHRPASKPKTRKARKS